MSSSSSGKKHKKAKKHRHRSVSRDETRDAGSDDSKIGTVTLDLTADAEEDSSSTSRRRHHHHHKHKKQHKEHRHKDIHKPREREREQRAEIISVEESDSDSSDCVEVVVDKPEQGEQEFSVPLPPVIPKHGDYEREHRDKDREREKERDRERQHARERERERERERAQRERERDREWEREREREIDRERERDRQRDLERRQEREAERERELERRRERDIERERESRNRGGDRERSRSNSKTRSFSPVSENGAGDVLSIDETNKLRAKLGLKPLEVDSGPKTVTNTTTSNRSTQDPKRSGKDKELASYKDEWGEFLHKPADNIKEKKQAEKLREKLKQRKEKRFLEERLARISTLGQSDEKETDDVKKWVERNKRVVDQRKAADLRAKALEEFDAELGVKAIVEQQMREERRKAYNDANLKGLTVEHDMDDFTEGRTVILTLKDQEVLNEEDGDTLVNVNMIDDARYKKNVANKKLNPQSYGYNVYEEQYDELGNPIERGVLEKYDEDIDGEKKRTKFVIGENLDEEREHRRKLLEIKTKLAGKRLERLDDTNVQLASDTFSAEELTKFKKPKKKVKKLRQKLKADDLLPLGEDKSSSTQNFGSRNGRYREADDDDDIEMPESKPDIKLEDDDDDDLQRVLSKARKLKQKDNIIKMQQPMDLIASQEDILVKEEPIDGNIVLNDTAEFCRTLGDIPTYGMAGNRNEDSNDMMDFEVCQTQDEWLETHDEIPAQSHGTWNSVNPDEVIQPADLDTIVDDIEERAILDEEPDVSAGMANALRLALSKGYLEKEEHNRPSNSNMAHLQAKNYSIDDKAAVEDNKVGRRDRFYSGPIMDFKDKKSFKPNVKLEYIDDNGRILNNKEAFRYLSHKFHGKGSGKNKIEKRLKKTEREGLMKTMSSTDTPLGTLTMLQQKQKETKTPYVVLSGSNKTATNVNDAALAKFN